MNLIPTIVWALTLGAGTPEGIAMTDQQGNSLFVDNPATYSTTFQVEASWANALFFGGKIKSTSETNWDDGFTPLQSDYKVYVGLTFKLKDIDVTLMGSHGCLHPMSSYQGKQSAYGLYGATNELSVELRTGQFLGR